MRYDEIYSDLFNLPNEYILAHCISADFAMGAGIAIRFRDMGIKSLLNHGFPNYVNEWKNGECLIVHIKGRTVCNLVTKKQYWQKPTYDSLKKSLISMRKYIEDGCGAKRNPIKIGMPLIGCGLDGLQWVTVSGIIKEVFKDTDTEIVICRL